MITGLCSCQNEDKEELILGIAGLHHQPKELIVPGLP